jgi:putative membrane protein
MASEHRLHPASLLFSFAQQLRALFLPGVLVLVGARSRGGDWEPWMMLLIIPSVIGAALRYLTYRYRYDGQEMVIRSGLLFRKERHIPYGRIQNIDAVQRVLHRALGVVEVRIETGSGSTPEATMSVLPLAALADMRERVFSHRDAPELVEDAATPQAQATTLLDLTITDLMRTGFIENRGGVLIGAAMGILWEAGLLDRGVELAVGEPVSGRRLVREGIFAIGLAIAGRTAITADGIATLVAAIVGFLVVIRLVSMAWAVVRLHGFKLTLHDADLRTQYGLLTKVASTIPLGRIQSITIRETPLHRVSGHVSIEADTAGGKAEDGSRRGRESLAPLVAREHAVSLVQRIVAPVDMSVARWQPVSPRAFRREIKGWIVLASAMLVGITWIGGWWAVAAIPALAAWAIVGARQTVRHLGWAVTDDAVMYRRGWLWRRVTVVRLSKIQAVDLRESPFDRRSAMARVKVDTAGASERGRVDIPYLPRDIADEVRTALAHEAARRELTW